ncbi:heme peroxidase [Teladorsagia circumcincta]|uniref:Heme peroxidase n=1 Tax=Teladorsagia circumcincta TaxID=45464 RepID=A0A2G9UEK6_TELCI|nr:heme peroxidase [Teladorsagia circumcincta]
MDGTCNNLQHPLRGAAYRPYTRLLPTVYDNGLSEPVGSMNPQMRPSPRAITRHLTSSHASVVSEDYNAMVMQFGQFISHDMAKTTLVPSAKCNVCQNITSRCMAVSIASDDPNAGFRRNGCVRVSRSSPICGSGNQKPRQQLNENTAYLDASPIYGSSVADMAKFREGRTGFLKLPSFHGMSTGMRLKFSSFPIESAAYFLCIDRQAWQWPMIAQAFKIKAGVMEYVG